MLSLVKIMIILRACFHHLFFLVIALHKKTQCQGDCDNGLTNPGGKCCANYHMVNGSCQVCPVGYFGSNCMVPCYYPTFGRFCKQDCQCDPSDCNHMYGCESDDVVSEITSSGQPPQEDKKRPEAVTDPTDTDRNKVAGDCENYGTKSSGGGCCSNYHMVNGVCEACPVGYFGSNCGVPCSYPSFGQFCLLLCNCSKSECDHRSGCEKFESTVPVRTTIRSNSSSVVTSHRFTVPIVTTYHPSVTNPPIEFNSTSLTLIIGGIVIFFLIVIIIFQIYERNCKNRERNLPAVHVQRSNYEDTADPVYCDIDDRYETMETSSPPATHKKEDMPLIEVASDPQLVPLAPLKNDPTGSSGPGWEESSDEKSTEPEVSSSNSTSSSGSYLKPVTTQNKHKYAKIIDSADGDTTVCIESSETTEVKMNTLPTLNVENETVIGVHSKDNPYLDVIHN